MGKKLKKKISFYAFELSETERLPKTKTKSGIPFIGAWRNWFAARCLNAELCTDVALVYSVLLLSCSTVLIAGFELSFIPMLGKSPTKFEVIVGT